MTDANSAFAVTIIDPCSPATITTTLLTDQIYFMSSGPKTYQAAAFTINESWCVMTYSFSSSAAALNAAITFDAASRTFTFDYATDLSLSGPVSTDYILTMTATSQSVTQSETFTIAMKNPCIVISTSNIALPTLATNQIYFVGAG